MNISEVVGHKVMVLFHSVEGLGSLGIDDCSKYCKIVGFDNLGLWVENPQYEETPLRDANGSIVPPERRERRKYVAHILILWSNIRALVHFPNREREHELESEDVHPIGSYL